MGASRTENHEALERIHRFPPYDMSPLTGLSPHGQLITERVNTLYALMTEPKPVVITSLEALSYRVMPKKALTDALEYLEEGEEVDREDLVKTLEMNGYQHSSMVEERGDYSIRGGSSMCFPRFMRCRCASSSGGTAWSPSAGSIPSVSGPRRPCMN
jgi:transcription-repair coupling factor (superfamily II helicase)